MVGSFATCFIYLSVRSEIKTAMSITGKPFYFFFFSPRGLSNEQLSGFDLVFFFFFFFIKQAILLKMSTLLVIGAVSLCLALKVFTLAAGGIFTYLVLRGLR